MPMFELIFLFIFGLCVGSFLNVLIDRLPNEKSVIRGRSSCDHCRHPIAFYDLVPVLSFFILKGRCRHCRKKISIQYPLVELATGLCFVYVFLMLISLVGRIEGLLFYIHLSYFLIVVSSLIVIFVTDLKYRIIPDQMLIVLAISSLIYFAFSNTAIIPRLISALLFFLLFLLLFLSTGRRGMGFGDVKFAAVLGFIFDLPGVIVVFYLSFLTGAAVSLILIIVGAKRMKSAIAFGPFLSGAAFVSLFYEDLFWGILKRILGI